MESGKKYQRIIHYLPVLGCFATAIIYISIGIVAILSYSKLMDGGADEASLIALLQNSIVGKILVCVLIGGTGCYIFWRIYESITDPYSYGKEPKGLILRTCIALSTVTDGLILYSALRILTGLGSKEASGPLKEEHQSMEKLLQTSYGRYVLITVGAIVLATAIILFLYGISRGYKERLESEQFNTIMIRIVHFLALLGFASRSIILGIIGFFYVKAGVLEDAFLIVNTDKAFDFIGDNLGGVLFLAVASGTICYGIFTFALGFAYDIDKD